MNTVVSELRLTLRTLRKHAGFSAVAVLTIALGIGANSAIFSVVRAVLLRPLPYDQPDRLVVVWSNLVNRDRPKFPLSPPDVRDLQEQTRLFDDFAGVATFEQTLTGGDGDPERIVVAGVTPNFLDLLGVRPVIGRGFEPADAAPIASGTDPSAIPPAAVLLSHELWQRRMGGDRAAVGRTIELNDNTVVVVGVLPPGLALHFGPGSGLAPRVDVWATPQIDIGAWPARRNVIWRVVGRMAPGVTVAQAQAELDGIAARWREAESIRETAGMRLDVFPMLDDLTAPVRPVMLALLGAVGFVLLIACANVSNLMLVRAAAREREFAIRAALGGNRARLVRQLLLESGALAAMGGLLGLLLALGGIQLLLALRPANLPRLDSVGIDAPVLGFTAAATALAALLFGLVPALQASRPRLADSLQDRGRSATLTRQRLFRHGLVVVEVALSVVLLIGAGLMVRSFAALQRVEPGYDPEGLLTFSVSLPGSRYPDPAKEIFYRRLRDQLGALPGVASVSAAFSLPLVESLFSGRYGTEEALADESRYGQADYRAVLPDYFQTMRTRLLAGRPLTEADAADSATVVVVDDKLARILWPGESAVGKRMLVRATSLEPQWVDVVGVVEHQRAHSLAVDGPETVYMTNRYLGTLGALHWIVRGGADPAALAPQIRAVVRGLDPALPVSDVRTMEDRVREAMTGTRFATALIAIFGVIALALASVGIYGVLSYAVRQRTAEIGVRMAFGAEAGNILRLVVGQGMTLTGIGLAGGVVAGFWATRLMRGMLVGVAPTDVPTFAAMSLVFLLTAAAACYIPARRAALVDPVAALREE